MVSLWPFKSDPNSAASFEKTLAALSTKIQRATSKNDALRQSARRVRVGLLLYAGFAYILIFVVLTLVTGYKNWGAFEYSIIAGGPPLVYGIRELAGAYYGWRLASSQRSLDALHKDRDATIQRLKDATKYDSTQQLLDKYGTASPKRPDDSPRGQTVGNTKDSRSEVRVFRQPPPTANIVQNRQRQQSANASPQISDHQSQQQPSRPLASPESSSVLQPGGPQSGAEFAPNAFADAPPHYVSSGTGLGQSRWYDRIMDALLGDDETQARNRIALICQQCRLVNGLAPPGTKTLEEVGRWRCSSCGSWNGEESETSRLMQKLSERQGTATNIDPAQPLSKSDGLGDDSVGDDSVPAPEANEDDDARPTGRTSPLDSDLDGPERTPSRSLRSRNQKSGKVK